jgi:hypothetical protein
VRWIPADAVARTGTARVPPGGSAGDITHIWLDSAGRPAPPPLTHDAIFVNEITAGMISFTLSLTVMAGVYGVEYGLVSRRRALAWERNWATVEPVWSGRIQH